MDKYVRIKEITNILDKAAKAYYQNDKEIMSNKEYDDLYDELLKLEEETGITISGSVTKKVGYEIISELQKEKHSLRMLSLDKTKEVSKLKSFVEKNKGILSWKLDGLTIVLTYNNGKLEKAVTRGNGEIGEVITNNAKVFKNIPINIPYKGNLIIRGEAVIKYSDFNKINEKLEGQEQYKNPRNLCSGTVRQLNNEITAKRNVNFFAFQLVNSGEIDFKDSKKEQLKWLDNQGFEVVEHSLVTSENIEQMVSEYERKISLNDFGSDGLVLTYDKISYSEELGTTSKFPRDSIAFKWTDEIKETKLIEIEWSASRTGLINPVAIFEPVELEGTTVSRASLHNISIMEELHLGIGDDIKVYKANMIIPQVAENITKSDNIQIPKHCPVCGGETEIKKQKDVKSLYCKNDNCSAKLLKAFSHFVGRNAMNIEGLSEATLDKFIENDFISEFCDIYIIQNHKDKIINMEGFGEKSYTKLIDSIEKSKQVDLANFIFGLGIQNVGLSNAKLLCKYYNNDFEKIKQVETDKMLNIEGIGEIIAEAIYFYFSNEHNKEIIKNLLEYITFNEKNENQLEQILENISFVITGKLNIFSNRDGLKQRIEALGGKVIAAVSKNTNYLINNDNESNSSKNKKAKELEIPILTEQLFIDKWGK